MAEDSQQPAPMAEDALPYGGDMRAAMHAQDRAAIRRLLEIGNSSPARSAAPSDAEHRLEDAACPICRELLYKPTVNACGHAFCFWCLHFSMDPLSRSSCPICRAPLLHLPAPCLALHLHLCASFPSEYARRAAETNANEKAWETSSPPLPTGGEPDWSCVTCGCDRAKHARVSVCGHLSCADCVDTGTACAACGARQAYVARPCHLISTIHGETARARAPASPSPLPPTTEPSTSRAVAAAAPCPYVHFGVGCDGCGAYPISGRAWKCQDCPEAIGFDLCDDCHGHPFNLGRFGQSHKPTHRMEEREQVQAIYHTLQADNPEMSMREIVQLVQAAIAAQERQALPSAAEIPTEEDAAAAPHQRPDGGQG